MWHDINGFAVDGYWLKITFGLSKANAQFFAFSFIELESVNLRPASKFVNSSVVV